VDAPPTHHRRGWLIAGALVVVVVAVLVGLQLSSSSPRTSASAHTSATCRKVNAVLSDGPDPSADPVGYAEAQVLPLRQITTSNALLHRAITQLSAAYKTFFDDNGTKTAQATLNSATRQIDKLCPEAISS
jgi:hypothetical protein